MSRTAVLGLLLLVGLLPTRAGGSEAAPAAPAAAPAPVVDLAATPRAYGRQCFVRKPLSEGELAAARIAWKYFERNYQPETGLVNAVDNYPSSSLWDLGSSLMGFIGARELGLISQKEFDDKVIRMLGALGKQRLFNDELPNKAYNAKTGAMSNYANQPTEGIGYSAIDLARMVSTLGVLACMHPKHRDLVQQVLLRWNYCRLVQDGQLIGVHVGPEGKAYEGQEGRLGYEQYAGKALKRLGFPADAAASYAGPHLGETVIYDVPIKFDVRDPKRTGAYNYVVTESYALDAMEFGQDAENRPLVRNIFEVQKRRWQRTGQVTAVTEDHIHQEPYFIYNTIFVMGQPWLAITDQGQEHEQFKSVSTKAAFSLAALFPDDPYAEVLLDKVESAYDPQRGWYSGIYERGGYNEAITSNTNGIVLEALLYKLYGPLHERCARCERELRFPEAALKAEPATACLPGQPRPPGGLKPLPVPKAKAEAAGGTPNTATGGALPQPAAPGGPAPVDAPPKAQGGPEAGKPPPAGAAPPAGGGAADPAKKPPAQGGQGGAGGPPSSASSPGPPEQDEASALTASAIPTGQVVVAPPITPRQPKGQRLRLGGNVSSSYGLHGELTGGVLASWSPASFFFVRAGASYAPLAERHRFRYLWGLGYDDWHERTLSVQLNNWGPITPERGLDVLGAQLHVGYKLSRLCLGTVCAFPYAYVDAPLRVGPAVGLRVTVTLRERWFLMGGASYAIPGLTDAGRLERRLAINYGVGWRHWQAGLPFLTFYNWGPSPGLRRGVLSLGVNWAL
jgi:hypothetical protein